MPVALRLRRALAALFAVAAVVPLAACDGSAGATTPKPPEPPQAAYLALGDSVAFGYRGRPAGIDYSKATNFTGYPELVGRKLGLKVLNASCPGETTASFTDVTAQSNGCENSLQSQGGYRTFFPLHVLYKSVHQSQLDFAVDTLRHTKNVALVTLQLGANDAFVCQQTTADQCVSEAGTLAENVETNLGRILTALRDQGGYRGTVVVVTYYSQEYAGGESAPALLDGAISAAAAAHGAKVADGLGAFRAAALAAGGNSTAAGLVIQGDVHPTAKGQQLLAQAVERAAG